MTTMACSPLNRMSFFRVKYPPADENVILQSEPVEAKTPWIELLVLTLWKFIWKIEFNLAIARQRRLDPSKLTVGFITLPEQILRKSID